MTGRPRNISVGCGFVLVLAALIPCYAVAQADVGSGNQMLGHCEHYVASTTTFDVWDGECGGTISTLMFFASSLDAETKFCPPNKATNEQAARVVVNYMKSRPDLLHYNFHALASQALKTAWPCK